MINKIQVIGSLDTVLHNFTFSTEGMKLKIDGTHYIVDNKELFTNWKYEKITVPTEYENDETGEVININKEILTDSKIPLGCVEITIEPNREYMICLTDLGIEVLYKSEGQKYGKLEGKLIDRLCWFTVPKNTTTLDHVDINVLEVVEC